jgi:predicted ATP-grasp superfamily ATP-dependent carboligase
MNVLVTDGDIRSALAVTRSLGRTGYNVIVAGVESGNLSSCSCFCKKSYLTPDPLREGGHFAEKIVDIVGREKIDAIFPMTEESIHQLNKLRDDLPGHVILGCAEPEAMQAVSNKFRLFQFAQTAGVPIPETTFVNGVEDLKEKTSHLLGFPVVVKPALSRIPDGDTIMKTGVMYAKDKDELDFLYKTKPALRYPSMIQELVEGPGTGLFTLFDRDQHLALFSHRRILEKPPSGGVSVISESISLDPAMVECSAKLLSAVEWKGIAMVEFKRDIRDGKAKLMEINGRFWGSLQLAVSSGIDFPALCLDYYLGRKPDLLLCDYSVGRRLKWRLGILDHLIIRLKKGNRQQILPPDCPTLWQVAGELLKPGNPKTTYDVYDSEDFKPSIAEIKKYIKNLNFVKR